MGNVQREALMSQCSCFDSFTWELPLLPLTIPKVHGVTVYHDFRATL